MTPTELNEHFGLPGVLSFEDHQGLTRAQVTLPSASATLYLQGAHLTHWQPAGAQPVLFLSDRTEFMPGKAIRGGIPICFPWFGPRGQNAAGQAQPGPSHGFARIQPWELLFAAVTSSDSDPQAICLSLALTLGPTELSRSLGFDHFRAVLELSIGSSLTLKLAVANTGQAPLHFEEALHTYFAVADVSSAELLGLEGAPYLDKTDNNQQKLAPAGPLQLTSRTDRVFFGNTATITLRDASHHRTIVNQKARSATTVVWNPWSDGAATLADLSPDAWHHFFCVETANTAADAITLAPGESHSMQTEISLGPL